MDSPSALDVMNLAQVAKMIDKHPVTVQGWARAGKIPASKKGRTWTFIRGDILAWVRGGYRERANAWDSTSAKASATGAHPSSTARASTATDPQSRRTARKRNAG